MYNLSDIHAEASRTSPDAWYKMWIDHAAGRAVSLSLPPYPPEELQRVTNNLSGVKTVEHAVDLMSYFDKCIDTCLSTDSANMTALDFGAGWGRLTRLLLRRIAPQNLFAADVDERLIASGQACLNGIDFKLIKSGEALPYADSSLDLVIANSVFSHLSEESHKFYLSEIHRICRSGGVFLATTLSLRHLEEWQYNPLKKDWAEKLFDVQEATTALQNGSFVYADTKRWKDYGIAIVADAWIEKAWEDWSEVHSFVQEQAQDVRMAVK